MTSFFEISRGAQQGDPLSSLLFTLAFHPCFSPLLFTLVVEVLGAAIRNCKDIKGVCLPSSSEESKMSQYADDGNFTLVDDYSIAE